MANVLQRRRLTVFVALAALLGTMASLGFSSAASGTVVSASSSSGWVRDTTTLLDTFAPDEATDYFFDAFGTDHGARTVIAGRVPHARYWSFTIYPGKVHAYDSEIRQHDGRYRLTIATNCNGIAGTCLPANSSGQSGIVLMRMYVPVDLSGAGTGAVPLPSISYESASGASISQQQATGSSAIEGLLASSRAKNGALPATLTRPYPAAGPVPVAVTTPAVPISVGGSGPFSNPDNDYLKLPLTTTRGDLIVSAEAPTYRTDSFAHANNLNRPVASAPQTRYWSLCIDYKGDYTGACLRDEQIHLVPGTRKFTVVIAPSCPVAGFTNCLVSGPAQLQRALLYRNLLPSRSFARVAFTGPYKLTATYIARPS
jgi:hypothetical protein